MARPAHRKGTRAAVAAGRRTLRAGRLRRLACFLVVFAGMLPGVVLGLADQLPDGPALRIIATQPQIKVDAAYLAPGMQRRFSEHAVCHCPLPLPAEDIPNVLKQALIATEDSRFVVHRGVDWIAFTRALVALATGGGRQGGSTITQQLAKTLIVGAEARGWRGFYRKIREAIVARRLERAMSKEEILAAYLNMVDFGSAHGWAAFGVEQAALKYFGKPAARLNLYEAAQLIGTLNGVTAFNPIRNPAAAHTRTAVVLDRMVEHGFITRQQAAQALRNRTRRGDSRPIRIRAGYYVDWAFAELSRIAGERRLTGQVRFVVPLDGLAQVQAERAIRRALGEAAGRDVSQAALVSMRPNGEVIAMVGGRDYRASQFNRATTPRQPASTFKLFVYAAALAKGADLDDTILDAPLTAAGWPANADHRYRGLVTIREAFAKSLNAPAARLAQKVGGEAIVGNARQLGIVSELRVEPGLALGASEVEPLELTAAYAVVANGGWRVRPHAALLALGSLGEVKFSRAEESKERVLGARVVGDMQSSLRSAVTAGTGRNARLRDRWSAGKTGTSDGNRDAWFVGYTTELVTGIWFGNDDHSAMANVSGGDLPASTWRRYNASMPSRWADTGVRSN